MASKKNHTTPRKNQAFQYDDDIDQSLWDSPAEPAVASKPNGTRAPSSGVSIKATMGGKSSYEDQVTRDASLRQELESIRKVNHAIEGVIESLERAKSNMKTVNQTVVAASTLLNTWTRILSQTEHNQAIILDPSWQGASQDIADMEQEAVAKQRAIERQEAEEQERRLAATRKAEEEERRRVEGAAKSTKPPTRGRGRPVGRGGVVSGVSAASGYVAMAGSANTSTSSVSRGTSSGGRRGASGIGRGVGPRGTRGGRAAS